MKSYISIINDFWTAAERESLSISDIAIFFYILHRINRNRWQMPVACPTTQIASALGISRETITKARQRLMQKGLLYYTEGRANHAPAQYSLEELSGRQSGQASTEPSIQLSGKVAGNLTVATGGIIYPIEDKEEDKDKTTIIINAEQKNVKEIILHDSRWHQAVADYFKLSADIVSEKVKEFISYLELLQQTPQTEEDTRKYFVNWLSKNISKNLHNNNKRIKEYGKAKNNISNKERMQGILEKLDRATNRESSEI